MKNLSHFIVLKGYILISEKDFSKKEKNKEIAVSYVPIPT